VLLIGTIKTGVLVVGDRTCQTTTYCLDNKIQGGKSTHRV